MRVPINEYRVDVESPKGFGYERRINEKKVTGHRFPRYRLFLPVNRKLIISSFIS